MSRAGARSGANSPRALAGGCLFMIIVFGLICIWAYFSPSSREAAAEREFEKRFGSQAMAMAVASEFVDQKLGHPARFECPLPDQYRANPDGAHVILGSCQWVTPAGVPRRSGYICIVKLEDSNWKCISLDLSHQ